MLTAWASASCPAWAARARTVWASQDDCQAKRIAQVDITCENGIAGLEVDRK